MGRELGGRGVRAGLAEGPAAACSAASERPGVEGAAAALGSQERPWEAGRLEDSRPRGAGPSSCEAASPPRGGSRGLG